ncbi:serine/threonine-protein kinase [Arthrobacter glacialis]|uniref:serine/threonine-protein kinase n=1 Tax=Arthrobacter glacialis TaxID=1664 RepID=UPI000CD48436|nr:serine/threonine-protein kinase [Arthrobacter glacialis]POH60601.1 serine/threonine protein kinase [Arthrobacter glacialis]
MSSKRVPAAPPVLPGYRFVSVLGSGGFSDVYLYEQDRPRRKVAVKVLTADLKTSGARASFESEANLMAQLSAHPYIVTIFEAEITDSGHSYLAMEYCSRPSLDMQYRQGRFSADKALEIGIQVASAVETAHRAGIAHRDIKPANILVTDYNRPALTDFGISGTMDAVQADGGGMSIPWSPPESFGSGATDGIKVDVWALGATIYTLLAGHSPFVIPGADNSQRELIARINAAPLPALGRADIPAELELVLATAMAKSPASRYSSAKDFARALMRIQADMNLSVTPFEVQEEIVAADFRPDDHSEPTRVRSVVSIDPDASTSNPTFPSRQANNTGGGASAAAPHVNTVPGETGSTTGLNRNGQTLPSAGPATPAGQAGAPSLGAPSLGAPSAQWNHPVLESTVPRSDQLRPAPGEAPALSAPAVPSKKRLWLGLGSGLVLVAAVVVGIMVFVGGGAPATVDPQAQKTSPPPTALIVGAEVPPVSDLAAAPKNGGSEWSWNNPDPQEGDKYLWASVSAVDTGTFKPITENRAFVVDDPNGQSCISVKLVRKDGQTSAESKKCS